MKRSTLLFAALAASAILARAQAPVTQPPEPVDPSPINGETYYFVNQLSGLQADLNGDSTPNGDFVNQNTRSFSSLSQRWAVTKLQDGNWKISIFPAGCVWTANQISMVPWQRRTFVPSMLLRRNGRSATPQMVTT
jgi:hypothetical protein